MMRAKPPELHLLASERKLLLALGDLLVLNAAFFAGLMVRSGFVPGLKNLWAHAYWFVLLSLVWLVVAQLFDAYDLAKAANAVRSMATAGGAVLLTDAVYLLIPFVTPTLPQRRLALFLFPLLAVAGVTIWRGLYATVLVQPAFRRRALIVGAGWSGQTLTRAIAETGDGPSGVNRGTAYEIVGFIDDDPAKAGTEVAGIPVLGDRHDLVRLVTEREADLVIVAITHSQAIHAGLFQAILDCREMGVPVTTMATLYEQLTGQVPVEHAGKDLHVVTPLSQSAGHRSYLGFRRLADIMLGVAGCAVTAAMIPLVWLVNRLTSPGDVLYRQTRVGRAGKPFTLVKFRSMVPGAEEDIGVVWARKNDPRITPLGRLFRKARLDELPQFWNVLKGEMSLIGPRPERPELVEKLAREIPFYRVRHAVRPGITGWAQVKYDYGGSVEDALIKLRYDLYYIKHEGPYLDLLIVLKTIQVILGMGGR
ncbi:MAG: sugar transferase [Acidobacteria bacterium]|nr:sugar transferase [Acidobacteriota bacterium]